MPTGDRVCSNASCLPRPTRPGPELLWVPPPPSQVPRSSLRTLPLPGWESYREVWSSGKRAVLRVVGRASRSPTRAQGPRVFGLIAQGWVTCPEEGSWRGACPAPAWPASWPKTSQPLGQKPSPGGLPTVLPSVKDPLYGWKNRGIFAVGGTGRRGRRVCRHVGQLLAPRPHVSEPHGVRGPLIAGCRCPVGVKGRRGHSPVERAPGPHKSPRENTQPWPQWLQ